MRSILAGAAVAIALSSPAIARAQSADDVARADSLFDAAKALLDSGQTAEACAKFAESKRLAPGLGVTLYLADCYERIGRVASAYSEFRAAEGLARQRNDKRAAVAHDRAQALEPRLSRLVVTVAPTIPQAGLQLLLDGTPLSSEEWGLPTPVDPGDHVVVVMTQGRVRRTIPAHVTAESSNVAVRVDSLDEPAPTPAPASAPAPAPESTPAPPPETPAQDTNLEDPGRARRWIGIGAGAAGVVGLGVGAIFGVAAMTKLHDSNDGGAMGGGCDSASDHCTPQGTQTRESASHAATASTIFFVVGAAAVAAGVAIYLTAPRAEGGASASVAPAAMPGGGGALLRGAF